MSFIDIHGHYAWNIDDGMKSIDETKKALLKAKTEKITEIVVTPHIKCSAIEDEHFMRIKNRINDLKILANEYGIKVHEGCELQFDQNIYRVLEQKLFITIAGTRYVLCEYDLSKVYFKFQEYFGDFLADLIYKGYIPILAHIERYYDKDIDFQFISYLKSIGCCTQINTTSILHKNPVAFKLLDKGLVDFISTDAHSCEGNRSPNMQECYNLLVKCGYSKKYLNVLFYKHATEMICNQELSVIDKYQRTIFSKIRRLIRDRD